MAASGSRSFDFGSDDVLCSYDDFSSSSAAQETKRPDPSDPTKDFHENRTGRPLVQVYEQESYPRDDVLSAVEKCMKKYADNLLRSLEGISGRLSQLEIYCYKLERSIGEFRSDMIREQTETGTKLTSLEKHLQEVHRSIQIMRDKQELLETQKELAKLQSGPDSSKKNEESVKSSVLDPKVDDKPDTANQQLALVLAHQINTAQPATRTSEPVQVYKEQTVQQSAPGSVGTQPDRYFLSQAIVYYPQRQALGQDQRSQAVQSEVQYLPVRPPVQDHPAQTQATQQPQIVVTQNHQPQSFSPYQQQWQHHSSQPLPALPGPPVQVQPQQTFAQSFPSQSAPPPQQSNTQQFPQQSVQSQQLPPQPMQLQHPSLQTPVRSQTPPPSYPPYAPHQPMNPNPEALPGGMPAQGQGPYSGAVASSGMNRSDTPFSYGGPGVPSGQPQPQHNMQRQQPPQPSQGSFGAAPPNKGNYGGPMPYPPPQVNPQQGYNVGYGYPPPPSSVPTQQAPPGSGAGMNHPGSQMMRGHPYGEMIEKAINMGYPRDQVMVVTQRMTESGQPVDFNALLDRLNEPSRSRGW